MTEDGMKFLFYDITEATENGETKESPLNYMEKHFDVINGVPQVNFSSWWSCVKGFDFDLPTFIKEMSPYNLEYWRDGCYKDCEYFKRSENAKTQYERISNSCFGGINCLKKEKIWFDGGWDKIIEKVGKTKDGEDQCYLANKNRKYQKFLTKIMRQK